MKTFVKVLQFLILSFLSFAFIAIVTEHPEWIRLLALISAIFGFILIYPMISNWQKRSLNNLAHTVMAFQVFGVILFTFYANNENIIQFLLIENPLTEDIDQIDIIHIFLHRFFIVVMFMPRFLSLYSGSLLCWKLIKNHNQGGPYNQLARLYQGSAVIFWLIELVLLVVILATLFMLSLLVV